MPAECTSACGRYICTVQAVSGRQQLRIGVPEGRGMLTSFCKLCLGAGRLYTPQPAVPCGRTETWRCRCSASVRALLGLL